MKTIGLLVACAGLACGQGLERPRDESVPAQAEAIYTKGLQYLAKSQKADGSWGDGGSGSEPAVVGLSVASFLAHGEDPHSGPYAKVIQKGVEFIIKQQDKGTGYIGNSMYNHGFATKALAEAYGVVDNPDIARALEKAVALIVSAQKHSRLGGWRYTPTSSDADSTVTGCCLVALFAARNAGVAVPDEAIKKGLAYLAKCRGSDGSVGYTSSFGGKPTLAAICSLCFSLAKERDSKGYKATLEYLRKNMDYRERQYPFYYEYYMSQALFHGDEDAWRKWNATTIRYFATIQGRDGAFPSHHGPAFSTAGALMTLAVNYRFLPIYEK